MKKCVFICKILLNFVSILALSDFRRQEQINQFENQKCSKNKIRSVVTLKRELEAVDTENYKLENRKNVRINSHSFAFSNYQKTMAKNSSLDSQIQMFFSNKNIRVEP